MNNQWRDNTRFGEDGERGREIIEKDRKNFGFRVLQVESFQMQISGRTSMGVFV